MRTWVFRYIRDSEGNYIPWLDRVEYYSSRTTNDAVWSINVYRFFPRKREQVNTTTSTPKENADGHTSNAESSR
jgi:hypothetical protein